MIANRAQYFFLEDGKGELSLALRVVCQLYICCLKYRVVYYYYHYYYYYYYYYCMAGNFRGVLIFVIFVVDSAVTKFSTHEN